MKTSRSWAFFIALPAVASLLFSACASPVSEQADLSLAPTNERTTTEQASETEPTPSLEIKPSPTPIPPEPTPTPFIRATLPEPDRTASAIYEANPRLTPVNYESPALLAPTEDMGQAYIDQITFICDSPTYWMWPHELLSGGKSSKQIWTGPEGTMTLAYQGSYCILDPYDRIERPIREVVERHKPPYIIIAVGINGISFMDEAYFTAEYTDLVTAIQRISPETTLLLQSIYPITPRYKHWGNITNAMITEGNSWILGIAEKTGCKYLDTFSVLVGENGHAKPELMRSDGLHPNDDGLRIILDYIRTHGYIEPQSRPNKTMTWAE